LFGFRDNSPTRQLICKVDARVRKRALARLLGQRINILQSKNTFLFVNSNIFPNFALRFKKHYKSRAMSRVCQITGKAVMGGNSVSHSNIKTKRKFYPNLQTKKFYIPEEDKYITIKVSAQGIRTINKKGISACLKEARKKGFLTK
jgi:large subunit ribosomal protein L28